MIKAVLFDFDETLQNRTEAFEHYMDAFFAEYMPELSGAELKKRKDEMRLLDNGGYVDRIKWHEQLTEKWGWTQAPPAEELAEHYIRNFGKFVQVFKDAPEAMKELKKRGYTVGILTNGPAYLQKSKIENGGLMPLIDFLMVSGDVGIHKPDKRLFEIAAERLNINCSECVYVGDHPVNDIAGATGAGMKAIRMNFGWFKDKDLRPDVPVIDSIIQTADAVDRINKE